MNRFLLVALVLCAAGRADGQERKTPAPKTEEGFSLNTRTPAWEGFSLHAVAWEASNVRVDVPFGLAVQSNGTSRPFQVRLNYESEDYTAYGLGLTGDFDTLRVSLDVFDGSWKGDARLYVDDGVNSPTTSRVNVDGDLYGIRGGIHWPALQYKAGDLMFTLGPDFSVFWLHTDLESLPESPLPFEDKEDQFVGRLGPRAIFCVPLGRKMEFSVEAAAGWLFGSSKGVTEEINAGIGIKF